LRKAGPGVGIEALPWQMRSSLQNARKTIAAWRRKSYANQ
jgi:hypothetical protein